MSWSFSFAAKDRETAKAKLTQLADQVPDGVLQAVEQAMATLPDTGSDKMQAISVSSYGHFRHDDDQPGPSNMVISLQQVENGPGQE